MPMPMPMAMPSNPQSASSSRTPPLRVASQAHIPQVPSQLRESHFPSSPDASRSSSGLSMPVSAAPTAGDNNNNNNNNNDDGDDNVNNALHQDHLPALESDGLHPTNPEQASIASNVSATRVSATVETSFIPTIRTRLLGQRQWDRSSGPASDSCDHGGRPHLVRNYGSVATLSSYDSRDGFGGPLPDDPSSGTVSPHGLLGDAITDGLLGGPGHHESTTQWLARRHGVKHDRAMYAIYNLLYCSCIKLAPSLSIATRSPSAGT